MDTSFDQEIHSFDMIAENFSGLAAIEQDVDHNPSSSVLLETGEEYIESNAATPGDENACNLLIKVEPEMYGYGSENVRLEVVRNVDGIKEEHILQSRNKVVGRERDLIDNLDHLSDSALNKYKNYSPIQEEALIKIETNKAINDFEEMHEVDIQEWKINKEDLNIKEDLEGNDARFEEAGISAQPLVKVETNDEKEIAFKDWKIKNEEADIKEELEECETTSISPHCADQTSKCTPEKSDQFVEETLLKSYLLRGLPKSDHCNHKTVRRKRRKADLLEEVKMFKCNKCDFQTKYKNNLKTHLLRHVSPEEVDTFKCNKCDFQTKYKNNLKTHWLQHNNSEDVKKFKCDQCSYRSFIKASLKRHLIQHMDPDEVETFKCNKCDFQTIYKPALKTHLLQHDVKKFKCGQCSYETISKTTLQRHLIQHMNPEKVDG